MTKRKIAAEPRFVPKPKDIDSDIAWAEINGDVLRSLERPRPLFWVIFFGSLGLFLWGVYCEIYQYNTGLGVAGLENPHVWGLYIATFIFWIGMSHSGTLLSAILHIMHADWRKPIYRFAEAMTTFSLMTAGLFVLVHLGRVWQFYYVVAYPNERWTWPNFSSPLVWDATAIGSYLTTSVIFLYFGMIPILRSAATRRPGSGAVLSGNVGRLDGNRPAVGQFSDHVSDDRVSVDSARRVGALDRRDRFRGFAAAGLAHDVVPAVLRRGRALFGLRRDHHAVHHPALYVPLRAVHDDSDLEKLCKLTFAISMVWTYLNLIEYASVWYGTDLREDRR
jgi:hypothetical protein